MHNFGINELKILCRCSINLFRIDAVGNVKVADFGLSKNVSGNVYFRQQMSSGVKLPIKWMAIECIEDGIFTEKTDIVRETIQ